MALEMMRAIVIREIGGPEALTLQSVPKPSPRSGEIRIRIKAFGLNRAEMFTRQGHSPGVNFPRILGIEATGIVDEGVSPESGFQEGDVVVTAMGGMGRVFDGGYAEYTVVPGSQVRKVDTAAAFGAGQPISWEILGALPELIQTAWGSLKDSLQLGSDDRLLIRGGTTSVGLAAAALAREQGVPVTATTRKPARVDFLKNLGIEDVLVDNGSIASDVKKRAPFSKILELVGVSTLEDSLQCAAPGGTVCLAGIAGNKWTFDSGFSPMAAIPSTVKLTVYGSNVPAVLATPIEEITRNIVTGKMKLPIKTFPFEKIVEAHKLLDEGAAAKIVILV